MNIQKKLFVILFGFGLVLVISLVLLMQWSIGQGLVDYVHSRELAKLAPLKQQLEAEYQQQQGWQRLRGDDRQFHQLIVAQLRGTEFAPQRPGPAGPGRRSGPPGQRPPPPELTAFYAELDPGSWASHWRKS